MVKGRIAKVRAKGKRLGRKPLPPVTVKKVIDAYIAAPDSSIRELAKITDVSQATVYNIKKGFQSGIYDRDGFRYEKPLLVV